MSLKLFDTVPDFTQASTEGDFGLYRWAGDDWVVLFSHPRDFTPVCTTELGAVARLKPEFDRRGVKVAGLSVDSVASHRAWASDIEQTQGVALNFPLIADEDRRVSHLLDLIHPNASDTVTVRSVLVIDPAKRLRL
ncbi:redoxin domain-containing protein, partial [Sphingomonas sp. 66-10]